MGPPDRHRLRRLTTPGRPPATTPESYITFVYVFPENAVRKFLGLLLGVIGGYRSSALAVAATVLGFAIRVALTRA